jgi:hypothetical protein
MSARVSTADCCNAWNPVASHTWATASFATERPKASILPPLLPPPLALPPLALFTPLLPVPGPLVELFLLPFSLSLLAFAAIPSSFTYFELTPLLHVPGNFVKLFVLPFFLSLLCFCCHPFILHLLETLATRKIRV